jgi:hypothetical protein
VGPTPHPKKNALIRSSLTFSFAFSLTNDNFAPAFRRQVF